MISQRGTFTDLLQIDSNQYPCDDISQFGNLMVYSSTIVEDEETLIV